MNVQYALKDGVIYVLEVNPRASRTVPFVAKVIGKPIAKIASRVMAGEKLSGFDLDLGRLGHVGVKEAVFPFARFPGVDTVLGPEMRSTGEVMGIDRSFEIAFAKSQIGAGSRPPTSGAVFVSVRDADKEGIVEPLRALQALGLPDPRHQRHAALPRRPRPEGRKGQQGLGGAAERGRHRAQRRRATDVQHDRGRDVAGQFEAAAPRRPLAKNALLHHTFGCCRGGRRDPRCRVRRPRSQGLAGLFGVTASRRRRRGKLFLAGMEWKSSR